MSIPKKGSRTVSLGSHQYRWRVRRKPTYSQAAFEAPMTVAIERVGVDSGTVLIVELRVSRPDNWIAPHQTAIKPAAVCQLIEAALADGWRPELSGSAFKYTFGLLKQSAR